MSLDKKLEWFKLRGWMTDEVAEVHKLVVDWFNNSYCTPSTSPPTVSTSLSVPLAPLVGQVRVSIV